MQNLYTLYNSTDPKQVGYFYPHIEILYDNPIFDRPTDYLEKRMPDQAVIAEMKLHYRAKPADYLASNYYTHYAGAIVSERFYQLIASFSSMNYQSFPFKLKTRKGELPYYVLHFFENANQFIDFEKTLFQPWSSPEAPTHQYPDWASLLKAKSSNKIKALYLKPDVSHYDFFNLTFPGAWVINEKVYTAIQEAKITGVEIIPLAEGADFTISKRERITRFKANS